MSTLVEMVAAVVVHSSAATLSHLGVVMESTTEAPRPAVEQRTVARSNRPGDVVVRPVMKASNCPEANRVRVTRV